MTSPVGDNLAHALARAADGDQHAFAEVYDQTSARVFGVALRVLRDRAQAEDVTQEAYLQVWRQAGQYDHSLGSVTSWITTIVHRRAVDRVRSAQRRTDRERREATKESRIAEPDIAESVVQSDDATRVRQAVAVLSDHQREAIELTYFEGATHVQAAEALDIPLGTLKSRVRDAMARLRRQIGDAS